MKWRGVFQSFSYVSRDYNWSVLHASSSDYFSTVGQPSCDWFDLKRSLDNCSGKGSLRTIITMIVMIMIMIVIMIMMVMMMMMMILIIIIIIIAFDEVERKPNFVAWLCRVSIPV